MEATNKTGRYEIEQLDRQAKEIEWSRDKCDNYDYMIAVFCGMAAGVVDALFVGKPGQGKLGQLTDKGADDLVQKIANMLWNGDKRSTSDGKPKHAPDTLEKSISYLEQAFPVNYDARYSKDLVNSNGALASMSSTNHHVKSFAHSPDIVGLIFSIVDQFTGKASFIDHGKVIRLMPVKDARNNKVMYMQGTTFESRLFCGVCNWLGHLVSDLVGSSSTRRAGKTGRGSGLPLPFYNLLLMMDFGNFDGKSFADIAEEVFKGGYDLRHGAAMAIPVLIEELSIKMIWVLKRRCYAKKDWSECIPSSGHADLRMMLLIGNASLCLVDGVDAAIRSHGNQLSFLLHLNLLAWGRLLMLVFRELRIRYGERVEQAISGYFAELGLNDRHMLKEYYERMEQLDAQLAQLLQEFVALTEKEYMKYVEGLNKSLNSAVGTPEQRGNASVVWARQNGVPDKRIVHTQEELEDRLGGR